MWKPIDLELSVPEMEDAVRELQQQVNALTAQNAALEAQLFGQQNIAQGRAQAPTRRMLVDLETLGKPTSVLG